MNANLIIKNIKSLITCSESGQKELNDAYIAVCNDIITEIGSGELPKHLILDSTEILDASGMTVTPGLIDSHTHLIHGGSRENELPLKLNGVSYLEILKMGGGILSTVNNTRNATVEQLKEKAKKSLNEMLLHGTTTVEAKSGYGLDFDTEIKCLEAAAELNNEGAIDIVSTYMGAHAIPNEYKGNTRGYIDLMSNKVMPYIKEKNLAEFVDVFCEHGVFSVEESREILERAKDLGFRVKIHADEIVPLNGAELSAEVGAISAEHLLAASDEGIAAMAKAGVVAVLLPGTSFYLMTGKYARAKYMKDMGVRVALATDYNPGSCPTENLQAIMPFACFGMKLTPSEIIESMTINAAYAIGRQNEIGSIEVGKKADIVIFDAPNINYLVYHFGINHVKHVVKNGSIVVKNRSI